MGASPDREDHKAQPEAVNLYRHIESWWGADFDVELIERIVNAPEEHQAEFQLSLWEFDLPAPLEEIPTGILRPALPRGGMKSDTERRAEGLRLLLYAQEIVFDTGDFFQSVGRMHHLNSMSYAMTLRQIMRIRPLVEDGSIKFASMWPDPYEVSGFSIQGEIDELLKLPEYSRYLEIDYTPNKYLIMSRVRPPDKASALLRSWWAYMYAACNLAASHSAHVLARSRLDQAVIRRVLHTPMVDNGLTELQSLAALKVPAFTGDISTLIKIRKSDDFEEWRNHLSDALTYVGELADEESIEDAAGIVHDQLSRGLSKINKAVTKSPALQAAKAGLAGFVLTGIPGTTTEVMTNDPWVGLAAGGAGGAAGMVLEAARRYVEALQARRKGHLIMDVAMLFDPQGDVENEGP